MVYMIGLMGEDMMAYGLKENNMDMESIQQLKVKLNMVYGKMGEK